MTSSPSFLFKRKVYEEIRSFWKWRLVKNREIRRRGFCFRNLENKGKN